jgi:hypothetical protein
MRDARAVWCFADAREEPDTDVDPCKVAKWEQTSVGGPIRPIPAARRTVGVPNRGFGEGDSVGTNPFIP